nr:hypothetical protein [uncultured Hyphomonas sp.]
MKYGLLAVAALMLSPCAFAQGAAERAAALKQWKADCSQDDPELRLAYVEDAVVNQGATVARLCVREALKSDDPDARALGLRAALAMTEVLSFPFDMPVEYQKALAAAKEEGPDEVEALDVSWRSTIKQHNELGGSFSFKQYKVSVEDTTTDWMTKNGYGKFGKDHQAKITTTADSIRIEGTYGCCDPVAIDLRLGPGGMLTGSGMVDGLGPYPIVAEIL